MISSKENAKLKKPFREGLFHMTGKNAGHLIGTRCGRCEITFFPGRRFCSNCFQNDQITEVALSKRGTLYTYTIVYQGKPSFKTPYPVGYVDLKEGVRIFTPIFDVVPEELKIGSEMELVFRSMGEISDRSGDLVYGFRLAEKRKAQ